MAASMLVSVALAIAVIVLFARMQNQEERISALEARTRTTETSTAETSAAAQQNAFAPATPTTPPASPSAEPDSPAAPTKPAAPATPFRKRPLESFVGGRLLAIVAAALVFVGLTFLGVMVTPRLTDVAKVAIMVAFSVAVTATGIALERRHGNTFTGALLGCGCGCLFISILVTHLYFGMISDIAAFLLLFVWLGLCVLLVRSMNTPVLAIVLQVGFAISVCLAYAGQVTGERLALLIAYQFAASVLVVWGNYRFFAMLYQSALAVSLTLSLVASWRLWDYEFSFALGANGQPPLGVECAIFLLQFAGVTVAALLLARSKTKSRKASIARLAAASAFWLTALAADVAVLVWDICIRTKAFPLEYVTQTGASGMASGACLVALGVFSLAIIVSLALFCLRERRRARLSPSEQRVVATALLLGFAAGFATHAYAQGLLDVTWPNLPLFAATGALALGCARALEDRWYGRCAFIAFAVDTVWLALTGGMQEIYRALAYLFEHGTWQTASSISATVANTASGMSSYATASTRLMEAGSHAAIPNTLAFAACIATTILLAALSLVALRTMDRRTQNVGLHMFVLFASETLLFTCGACADSHAVTFKAEAVLALATCVLVALRLLPTVRASEAYRQPLRANEIVISFVAAIHLFCAQQEPITIIVCTLVTTALLALLTSRLHEDGNDSGNPSGPLTVFTAIAATTLVIAYLFGSNVLTQGYQLSVCAMVLALAFVAFGFAQRISPLRLYGLVLALLCVAKLVVIDLSGLDSVARVVAFIAGGIVCFGISAVYNYAAKRLGGQTP